MKNSGTAVFVLLYLQNKYRQKNKLNMTYQQTPQVKRIVKNKTCAIFRVNKRSKILRLLKDNNDDEYML